MFLRRNRRKAGGETYEYWTLVESVRTPDGPRQRTVATLGKLPGLVDEERVGWEHVRDVLDGRLPQRDLFRADPEPPQWATVDTSRARVELVNFSRRHHVENFEHHRYALAVQFGLLIFGARPDSARK